MEDEATQPATQQFFDPRRLGRNNSGLTEADLSDVLCILHPASLAAFNIVKATAARTPQHVLQNDASISFRDFPGQPLEEQDTFIIGAGEAQHAMDLALRLTSRPVNPVMGFIFGRAPGQCDIVMDDTQHRISNVHFRIYVNISGVVMFDDMSTNGTMVDDILLKGKQPGNPHGKRPTTRMLNQGSIISILATNKDEVVKFIVRFPAREPRFMEEYGKNLRSFRARAAEAEESASIGIISNNNTHGMHWNGGNEYNVIGVMGKGAFATVYKLATALHGELVAAKELEKKRWIKDGHLDRRLDNEMKIMKAIQHPNIVQYLDYRDQGNFLYIIMELVPNGDLNDYLAKHHFLSEDKGKEMSRQMLNALGYLHKKNITHRDIKPDNILVASEEPFTAKLSDFGLSKVVRNDETFLKTFCGTLLYCAPEVFPDYLAKAPKRGRPGSAPPRYHGYSSSVDIWSYGAVLWYAMCGAPPIPAVHDPSGRQMLDQILKTRLNVVPLSKCGVSQTGIDLLTKMLDTDPSIRPDEYDCLKHPWLSDGEQFDLESVAKLNTISEEGDDSNGEDTAAGAEAGLSQLSIHETDFDDPNFDSGDAEFFAGRESKRVRPDIFLPRNQIRENHDDSSPEASEPTLQQQPREGRLFGEISQSAFNSSGVLDQPTNQAVSFHDARHARSLFSSVNSQLDPQWNGRSHAASLFGAESDMRDLQVGSPYSTSSPNEPATPRTPPAFDGPASETGRSKSSEDSTPKQPFFKTPKSLLSSSQASVQLNSPSLPATMRPPDSSIYPDIAAQQAIAASIYPGDFPGESQLGCLISSQDSISPPIIIKLNERRTFWGRDPTNTYVYPDPQDTRIAKISIHILFYAPGIETEDSAPGRDWTRMKGLHTLVKTYATHSGILVNGVKLKHEEADGQWCYGRVYTGDVITAFDDRVKKECLRFVCRFNVGEGAEPRPPGKPFKVLRGPKEVFDKTGR
ncbi:kinase-like protein [Aulographum hederae CBS 113979]|uniref:non-specific serine/threonine protein kinase n=1 Tax=Aulographum hederae CBS 113979 TaxID=1176131 RepID=A0A6G1GYW8_9PEZI|nr:kinase-like protein [Aulographum hederae CBS 113979]